MPHSTPAQVGHYTRRPFANERSLMIWVGVIIVIVRGENKVKYYFVCFAQYEVGNLLKSNDPMAKTPEMKLEMNSGVSNLAIGHMRV